MPQLVEEFLISLTVHAFITGAYFATFLLCMRWFIFSDDGETIRKGIKWPLLIVTIVLFALSLGQFAIFLHLELFVISKGRSWANLRATFVGVRRFDNFNCHRH
jgi:hypothetical protein